MQHIVEIGGKRRGKEDACSHVDHIVESKDTVGPHDAVDAIGHPIGPFGHTQGIGRRQRVAAVRLSGLVGGVCHQHKTKFFDRLDECRNNILVVNS